MKHDRVYPSAVQTTSHASNAISIGTGVNVHLEKPVFFRGYTSYSAEFRAIPWNAELRDTPTDWWRNRVGTPCSVPASPVPAFHTYTHMWTSEQV